MGAKLEEIYDIVTRKNGFKGRLRLAVRTGIPRAKAAKEKDTDKLVNTFKEAASEIIGKDIDEFIKGG